MDDLHDNKGYDYYLVEDGHQRTLDNTKVFDGFTYMRLQDISDLMPTFARSIPEATIVPPHWPTCRRVNLLTYFLSLTAGFYHDDDKLRVVNQILDAAPGLINTLHPQYHCPLLQSMRCVMFHGVDPIFELLLERRACPNQVRIYEEHGFVDCVETCLGYAIQHGLVRQARMLLAAKADPNIRHSVSEGGLLDPLQFFHMPPLTLAVRAGLDVEFIFDLLLEGAHPDGRCQVIHPETKQPKDIGSLLFGCLSCGEGMDKTRRDMDLEKKLVLLVCFGARIEEIVWNETDDWDGKAPVGNIMDWIESSERREELEGRFDSLIRFIGMASYIDKRLFPPSFVENMGSLVPVDPEWAEKYGEMDQAFDGMTRRMLLPYAYRSRCQRLVLHEGSRVPTLQSIIIDGLIEKLYKLDTTGQ